jgi:hypothetical protein
MGIPEAVLVSLYDPVLGKGREVARIEGAGLSAAVSPDGRTIATLMGNPSRSIRLYSVEGRLQRDINVGGVTSLTSLSWTADSDAFYCGDMNPQGSVRLLRVDMDGRTRVLWDRSGLWAKASPDRRHLAIYGLFYSSNAWAIRVR